MNDSKKRGPSAYNTPYDEFPDELGFFPPYMSLWLLEIMLLLMGGGTLASVIAHDFFPSIPWASFAGGVAIAIYISICNAMIAYARIKWVVPLQGLCIFYIIAAIPHFFYEYPLMAFIPMVSGVLAYWILSSNQFRVFLYHRIKLAEWRKDQLEKNKIRRKVIRERKVEAKAKKKGNV